MSFCTYIASDKPLSGSDYLWPLSRGSEDIYTEKVYVAQIVPDLDDLSWGFWKKECVGVRTDALLRCLCFNR